MEFMRKHKLSISIIIFSILFYLLFLYIDFAQIMFKISKNNESFINIIWKCWFFSIPTLLLIPLIIYYLVIFLKNNKNKLKWIIFILVLLFELLYTFIVSLYAMTPGFSFYPKDYNSDILEYNNVRLVEVNVEGNIYKSTYYDNNKDNVIIFFPGNSQTSSDIFEFIGEENLLFSDRNILVMDYPMFGFNDGRLTEDEIYREVDQYMSFLINDEGYDLSNIRVMGFSIGTGVACYCAEKYDVESLVLLAPYDKFQSAMNNMVNVFHGPLEFAVRFKFNSYEKAKNIKCHTIILYSRSDQTIPYTSTLNLISNLTDYESKEIDNASHAMVLRNDIAKNYILH